MKLKRFLTEFALFFVITFVVTGIVSFLYSLIAHSAGSIDWSLAFRNAIIFAVVFPTINVINRKK